MFKQFHLSKYPWLALLALILTHIVTMIIFVIVVVGMLKQPPGAPLTDILVHVTVLFLIVPFVLKLPEGTRSFKF